MPESPEVQALADDLDERLRERALVSVDVLEFRMIKTRSRQPSTLIGRSVASVTRHGKMFDLDIGDAHLVVSLGRHGWARWGEGESPSDDSATPAPALATLEFEGDIRLDLTDSGGWVSHSLWVVDAASDVPSVAGLGPDPAVAHYTRADFDSAFAGRRKQLKAVLEEQKSIAGIGNAYSDEILFAARLNPVVHASELGTDELDRLFEQTTGVIRSAIDARHGIPISELKAAKVAAMMVHGKAGEPCPGCDDTIRDFAFASTTAQYCPACQTGGVIL
ncbi:Fpg/Nei family DNA glycosylase [Planctomonas sp. JC2975]|uniref:DNA-formamidopyrimidine glycosylase family protein n=1 Tax=Planctomonas sp. JC2975 TaxID=2729626 RepID=UPI0014739977|nr:DNA-formamidopyrimidine glycosylase family protein [Planctomonas sp. JC2975]NNC11232.1 Fpg/Nei family DNA glycosylase [Planctomonas sp. JC2975]